MRMRKQKIRRKLRCVSWSCEEVKRKEGSVGKDWEVRKERRANSDSTCVCTFDIAMRDFGTVCECAGTTAGRNRCLRELLHNTMKSRSLLRESCAITNKREQRTQWLNGLMTSFLIKPKGDKRMTLCPS